MRRHAYNLMEIVVAVGLSGLLFTCAINAFHLIGQTQRDTACRQTAIQVLDNTVERIAAQPARDRETLGRIFQDEFNKSDLPARSRRFRARCETQNGEWQLAVLRPNGRALAAAGIPLK